MGLGLKHVDQGRGVVVGDDLSVVQDDNPVTDGLDDIKIVARQHDADLLLLGESAEFGVEVVGGLDIESECGFVQKNNVDITGERAGKRDLLFHPLREVVDRRISPVEEVESFEQFVVALPDRTGTLPTQSGEKLQILTDCEPPVDVAVPLEHRTDVAVCSLW